MNLRKFKRFNIGDKVTYHSVGKTEKGIVKSTYDENHVFVVYHCDDNWEDYENYTAARTCIEDLTKGWDTRICIEDLIKGWDESE